MFWKSSTTLNLADKFAAKLPFKELFSNHYFQLAGTYSGNAPFKSWCIFIRKIQIFFFCKLHPCLMDLLNLLRTDWSAFWGCLWVGSCLNLDSMFGAIEICWHSPQPSAWDSGMQAKNHNKSYNKQMTKRVWLCKNKIMEKQYLPNLCVDISHKLFPKLIEETFGF